MSGGHWGAADDELSVVCLRKRMDEQLLLLLQQGNLHTNRKHHVFRNMLPYQATHVDLLRHCGGCGDSALRLVTHVSLLSMD